MHFLKAKEQINDELHFEKVNLNDLLNSCNEFSIYELNETYD